MTEDVIRALKDATLTKVGLTLLYGRWQALDVLESPWLHQEVVVTSLLKKGYMAFHGQRRATVTSSGILALLAHEKVVANGRKQTPGPVHQVGTRTGEYCCETN